MLEYEKIIDKMAMALYEMFNGAANGLTVDHFKMVAATGLFTAMEITAYKVDKFDLKYGAFVKKYEPLALDLKQKNLTLGCK